jgi:hypothetical protein
MNRRGFTEVSPVSTRCLAKHTETSRKHSSILQILLVLGRTVRLKGHGKSVEPHARMHSH